MRFYGFGNYYLSSLQQGLQAGHTAVELFVKYHIAESEEKHDMLFDWGENHKTMVLLNGGNSAGLQDLFSFFDTPENPYPFCKFHEDEQSLNGALTYVGIVLPEKIYENAALLRRKQAEIVRSQDGKILSVDMKWPRPLDVYWKECSDWETELCARLNWYDLAK